MLKLAENIKIFIESLEKNKPTGLKGKLISTRNEEVKGSRSVQEALEALKALGYKQNELTPLLKELEKSSNESVDVILKLALQLLAQRRRQ